MSTWIFQANPDLFDIDAYLATWPNEFPWLVTRYGDRMQPGDTVYLWRNRGKSNAVPGVIAEATITAVPESRREATSARPFWRDGAEEADALMLRALIRPVRVASQREVLRRDWLEDDPILRELPNLKMAAGTNYPIDAEHAARLRVLWNRTGQDWSWDESLAGLWAYVQTYGAPVSRLPGSPVATVSLLIGRPITGVYNKVMNFRSLDPREARAGLSGAGRTDRLVWERFYDDAGGELKVDEIEGEIQRLWRPREVPSTELVASREIIEATARQFEKESLASLGERYRLSRGAKAPRPSSSTILVRTFDRDPVVIAYARKRAEFRCEIPGCSHLTFLTDGGQPYFEVHHIVPLAEGGEDTIENAACLCPSHHREIHLGRGREDLTEMLKRVRALEGAESMTTAA